MVSANHTSSNRPLAATLQLLHVWVLKCSSLVIFEGGVGNYYVFRTQVCNTEILIT